MTVHDGVVSETKSLSVVVSRLRGSVIVTVEGELVVAGREALEAVLADLIDGQGNLDVVLDLSGTTVERELLVILTTASRLARGHGAILSVKEPTPDIQRALRSGEVALCGSPSWATSVD